MEIDPNDCTVIVAFLHSHTCHTYKGKTLEISLYLAIKPRATKFCMYLNLVCSFLWCPWSLGSASALQSWSPEFESRELVSTLGFFIGPHIRLEYWCSSQEAESREISISCWNLFLKRCKINMFKLKLSVPSLRGINYSPKVKMGLYSEIFRNLVRIHGYQF